MRGTVLFLILMLSSASYGVDCSSYFQRKGFATVKFNSESRQFSPAAEVAKIYNQRSSAEHIRIDREMTQKHAALEMNFQVKNPKTGNYDKFQAVPVNTRTVVMSESAYSELIDAIEPVMQRLRKLLQNVYSGKPMTPQGLGLQAIPDADAKFFAEVIKSSMYLEQQLIDPVMADYPFLGVAGFDGAVGNPDDPEPKFFEMNLGTPSGLSNNIVLLENLLKTDPEVAQVFSDRLPKDDTYQNLKKAIDSNAKKWTGIENGISVVISPGIYNGAHADVVEIARRTGMPIVELNEIYSDAQGRYRLNQDKADDDPIISGFYGRWEESFFFQSSEHNIPLISPNNEKLNERLSKKLKIPLRKGAIYKYVYDKNNKAIDVERDEDGQPLIQDIWDKISPNPYTKQPSVPLHLGVLGKKLYYSNIGGRLIDDKRLFPLISKYLVQSDRAVAQPVSSLEQDEYHLLYNNPDNYVVKEPANSGGVGIHFLSLMSKKAKEALLKKVKAQPREYEVQEFRKPNVLKHYQIDGESINIDEVATDLRIFVFMDADGNVTSGSNASLLRTAPSGSFFSNTSQGGGYGIFVVLKDEKLSEPVEELNAVDTSKMLLSFYRKYQLEQTIIRLENLKLSEESPDSLRYLSFDLRKFLDLISDQDRIIISLLRQIADGQGSEVTRMQLMNGIQDLVQDLKTKI